MNWNDYIHIIDDNSYTDTFLHYMEEYISLHKDEKEREKVISLLLSSLPDSNIADDLIQEWDRITKWKYSQEKVRRLYPPSLESKYVVSCLLVAYV